MSELADAFRKSWQKAGDEIEMMVKTQEGLALDFAEETEVRLRSERNAWKEAFLATRAYYSNNNGPNSTRYRAAIKQLKEMKLIK